MHKTYSQQSIFSFRSDTAGSYLTPSGPFGSFYHPISPAQSVETGYSRTLNAFNFACVGPGLNLPSSRFLRQETLLQFARCINGYPKHTTRVTLNGLPSHQGKIVLAVFGISLRLSQLAHFLKPLKILHTARTGMSTDVCLCVMIEISLYPDVV